MLEKLDSIEDAIDAPSGKARAFNVMKMKELGYDIDNLPFSIRVLLENSARHSGRVRGALEAAHELARWPASVGKEMPFMPHRVLLQDYTGVPLVVDLAAMRDAAKAYGLDPRAINSGVPVDLVIDHSIQVDAWGNDMAFSLNLEKEYERNSERYSLLKWAQASFMGMRVFPPGKGICHQFNLEYLSRVVATSGDGGSLQAFPDTLVGTDSHTTMVNGLGCLGWGVGGIEAEAVMLGEPYHMPVPKVLGVRLTGSLREGVTPTDLVLTATEKLRERNVVGAFVEYFGDGYGKLSVPDRATLGNMSPEYGATSGFCPIDGATLAYLRGTARPSSHVDFVERYARKFGFFDEGAEPKYTEVLTIDLDQIEPSVAGPRNPEEKHTLSSIPSFAPTIYGHHPAGTAQVGSPGATRAQVMLQEDGPVRAGLKDGAVVIAAITSCTNTSNPTVMVGAGLIARKAVELGLNVRPWVKPSLAPGSTVVTDYLQNSGLLQYLDALHFNLVGYGCTTCIAEGTPVLLADGTTRPIESLPKAGGAIVFGPDSKGRLGMARQLGLTERGLRDCIELALQDGRTLVCTPDHKVLTADGHWVRADQLIPGKDRVIVGLEGPLDKQGDDESGYNLRAGDMTFRMETQSERSRMLAFARLLGHLQSDGPISVSGVGRMNVGQAVDREALLGDIELLTGLRPVASRHDERKWSIALPTSLTGAIFALEGVQKGRRVGQPPTLPEFVQQSGCPGSVVREFLGGLFGADGHAPKLHRRGVRDEDSTLEPPVYSRSTIPAHLDETREFVRGISRLLGRCGVRTDGPRIHEHRTRRSSSSHTPAQGGISRIEVRLDIPDGVSFIERVGFRYCVDKQMRGSAAVAYWRLVEGIRRQRFWMAARTEKLHHEQQSPPSSNVRQTVAVLVGGGVDDFPASLTSPRYAPLEGNDPLSRPVRPGDRSFRPLHRESRDFPSPVETFEELGVNGWFAPLQRRTQAARAQACGVENDSLTLPTFSLQVVRRRPAGARLVYDIGVEGLHAFTAGTVAVHNCIGNSGPLSPEVEETIKKTGLYSVAVLSGNRNFDGRIHPLVRGAFLMSPMLVVAYALAGRLDFDFQSEPLGVGKAGKPVFLKDLWPTLAEIKGTIEKSLSPELYERRYANAMKGDERWEKLGSSAGDVYRWDASSTYIRLPGWFEQTSTPSKSDVVGARVLVLLEDKVTTDHISPAGTIPVDSPAGKYLSERGVDLAHLSTYGSRRGNHEVMVRGGFSNIRLKNFLARGKEGGYTAHLPDGSVMPIYDAAMRYASERIPLIVLAGKQYGAGSSRDWAAKAPKLLGVRAVLAESFERIHRSNLVAMGVIPLQFKEGDGAKSLALTGEEVYDIRGLETMTAPKQSVEVTAHGPSGEKKFRALARVDNETEMKYLDAGGVLPYVFSKMKSSD